MMARSLSFLVISLVLGGCTSVIQAHSAQGPTGSDKRSQVVAPIALESYLIPPEIPPTLISYILTTRPVDSEIIALVVRDHSDRSWTLEISRERLPAEIITETIRYVWMGKSWQAQ